MPRPPDSASVVIRADDGPTFFTSLSSASAYIEWQDVETQTWGPGFDTAGRRVAVSLVWPARGVPTVELSIDANGAPRPEALRVLLMAGLPASIAGDVSTLTTGQLFALAADHGGVS